MVLVEKLNNEISEIKYELEELRLAYKKLIHKQEQAISEKDFKQLDVILPQMTRIERHQNSLKRILYTLEATKRMYLKKF